jgi:hypothetical protein
VLRIGVQFSDGSKATNTGGFPRGQSHQIYLISSHCDPNDCDRRGP